MRRVGLAFVFAQVCLLLQGGALALASPEGIPAGRFDASVIHTENDGRRYRIERVPKSGAKYERLDANTIRYFPYATYKVAGEDKEYFYVKQYVAAEVPPRVASKPVPLPSSPEIGESRRFALQDFGNGLPQTGQWREDFSLADINGDGKLELISSPARKTLSAPVVFLNDGKGNWQRWRQAKFPPLPYDYGAVDVADFNGDGIPDIAIAMHLRGLTVLTNDGKGNFSRYDTNLPLGIAGGSHPATYSSHVINSIDWNGDGKLDLITINEGMLAAPRTVAPARSYSSGLNIFLNSAGNWSLADPTQADRPAVVYAMVRARVTGKTAAPLLAVGRSSSGRIEVYEIKAHSLKARAIDGLPDSAIIRAVAAADLNGGGRIDLAISYQLYAEGAWRSIVDVYHDGPSGYTRRALLREDAQTIDALNLGHLSSRSAWDLVALRSDGSLLMFASDGRGFFTRDHIEPAPDWRFGCAGTAVHFGDLDGNGTEDIVATFSGVPDALVSRRSCLKGGGISAWKVVPASGKVPH